MENPHGVGANVMDIVASEIDLQTYYNVNLRGGAGGVMVIVVRNGQGDTSSNPERDWLHFT